MANNDAADFDVKIIKWNVVAFWKWIASEEECGICRFEFEACCPDCRLPGESCPMAEGKCHHYFHLHCIQKWIKNVQSKRKCPLCRQDWSYVEDSSEIVL
ncbi:Anaphase-promoting complex subunit 11-like [Oopsacas minuta]|uniref:Anaphase-promoting complex subunit 11 n=1 Tax=Oopsacas minuta TaxID=111878 RepID=A0AAV7K8Y2_9METZ|nr:Anaphase-promoting complex subunit 11-like [Oopsacas minuta]